MQKSFCVRPRSRVMCVLATVCLAAGIAFAGKTFVMPKAEPAKSYPAHDEHPMEHVTLAVDPYDMADKANIFSVKYNEQGFLPIFVVLTNDGDEPVTVGDLNAQLVTVDRTKIPAAATDDIYRRLSHPTASASRGPLPFPTKKVKGVVSKEALDEMQNSQFSAKAIEPHSTQAGFLFFDVTGISNPLAGANFYLTGVRNAKGQELLYFEVPMEKYLSAPTPAKVN